MLHKVIRVSHVSPVGKVTLHKSATIRDIITPTYLDTARQFLAMEVPHFRTVVEADTVTKGFNRTVCNEVVEGYNVRTEFRIVPVK